MHNPEDETIALEARPPEIKYPEEWLCPMCQIITVKREKNILNLHPPDTPDD